ESCSGGGTCVQAPSGIVGWYPGDGNANDISGTGNNGAFINGATTAPGKVLQAFSFDGVDDYVEAPGVAQQDAQTAATLDAWVFFNQTPSAAGRIMEIISRGALGNDFDLAALTDNKFYLYIASGQNVASTTTLQTGVWYHVAGTWDASGLRIYVNGVLENTNATPNIVRAPSQTPLRLGEGSAFPNRKFSGLIDEAEIFSRALTLAEIQAIYNAGSAGKCKTSPGSGREADVAPRPNGNNAVNAGDITQVQRFSVGLDQPYLTNEFQRADCAPRLAADNTTLLLGNGSVNSGDVTQAQRYAVGLDGTPPPAGGPTSPGGSKPALFFEGNKVKIDFLFNRNLIFSSESAKSAQATYEVRAVRESLTATTLTVAIRLDTDASASTPAASVGGTLRFNQTQLSNPTNIRLGSGAPAGTSFFANTFDTANGRLGFTINAPVNQTFGTGQQKLLLIDFTVIGTGATTLSFDSSQAQRFVGDMQGNELTNSEFPPTEISLSPTAATVSVSGRVLAKGRGIAGARISIANSAGDVKTTTTNSFGYFRLNGIQAGETYIFEVKDKRYRFANNPRILFIGEDFADLNFTALP
ncbi:MAG TPA: LamG-like jellyroll fold domain-containing protein, partial [Pyrinomonadaceae bacterium]|nr:LamG-like jellyroll fold domain-containing protein [Pyrinomonadaceae bacterium]